MVYEPLPKIVPLYYATPGVVWFLEVATRGRTPADLAQDELLAGSQISRFLILHKELDADDGELTRTRKVRRSAIAEKYGVLIDALYEGKVSQYIETQLKFEDGRTAMIAADLRIVEARTFPAVKDQAA